MKKIPALLLLMLGISATSFSQETDNTGDNFSLEGALAMFQKSSSLEAFEKAINEEGNSVNNLDLDNDGKTDYINVNDVKDGDTHAIVLSTYLNENEKQDIAVIGIEKNGGDSAVLQIEGDESLYGADAIAEPQDTSDAAGKGSADEITSSAVIVNVWLWPCVRFIYAPAYAVWVSPYRWAFYPRWWRPWHPYRRTVFITRCAPHRVYFHRVATRRVMAARRIYSPGRRTSTLVVRNRRGTTVVRKNRNGRVKAVKVRNGAGRVRRTRR